MEGRREKLLLFCSSFSGDFDGPFPTFERTSDGPKNNGFQQQKFELCRLSALERNQVDDGNRARAFRKAKEEWENNERAGSVSLFCHSHILQMLASDTFTLLFCIVCPWLNAWRLSEQFSPCVGRALVLLR
jgi:hypothetical protein